jgi:hypothetical protein
MPDFSFDWAAALRENVQNHLMYYRDKPCSVLEVGVFEGRGALVFLEQILTHPESKYTGVDDWWSMLTNTQPPERGKQLQGKQLEILQWINWIRQRAFNNLAPFPANKWRIIEKASHDALYEMHKNQETFDVVYIDGDHRFGPCFMDSYLAWPLVKDVMFWDDMGPNWDVTVAVHHFLASIQGVHSR